MASLKLKAGLAPLFVAAATIGGLRKDRFFTDNKMQFDDFTDDEAKALMDSFRSDAFEQVETDRDALCKQYSELFGNPPGKTWSSDKIILAIESAEPAEEDEESEQDHSGIDDEIGPTEPVPAVDIQSVATQAVIATTDDYPAEVKE